MKKAKNKWYVENVEFDTMEEFIALAKHNKEFDWELYLKEIEELQDESFTPTAEMRKHIANTPKMSAADALKKYSNNAQRLSVALALINPKEFMNEVHAIEINKQTINKKQKSYNVKGGSVNQELSKWNDIKKRIEEKSKVSPEEFEFYSSHNASSFENSTNVDYTKLMRQGAEQGFLPGELFSEEVREYTDTYTLFRVPKEEINNGGAKGRDGGELLTEDLWLVECKCPSTGADYLLYVDGKDERCTKSAISAIAWTFRDNKGEPLTEQQYIDKEMLTSES